MILTILALVANSVSAAPAETEILSVTVAKRKVTVGDMAILPAVLTAKHGSRVVIEIPESVEFVELTEARREQLVRRQFPALEIPLRHQGKVRFQSSATPAVIAGHHCFKAKTFVEKGEILEASDIEPAHCRKGNELSPLRYDENARMIITTDNIIEGRYLGSFAMPAGRAVTKGTQLKLVSRDGPVTVTRNVTTLQTVREGSDVFVRTDDGQVLSASFPSPPEPYDVPSSQD